jgi:hypothetical protein
MRNHHQPALGPYVDSLPPCAAAQITGEFASGASGDERPCPDFYTEFAAKRGKPMVVPETGAWYNLCDRDKAACGSTVRCWSERRLLVCALSTSTCSPGCRGKRDCQTCQLSII